MIGKASLASAAARLSSASSWVVAAPIFVPIARRNPAGKLLPFSHEVFMEREIEILRNFRLPPRGQLVVELAGRRYSLLSELAEPAARQIVIAAIGELVHFAGGYQTLLDNGVAPPIAPPAPVAEAAPPLSEAQARFMESLERQTFAMRAVLGSTTATQAVAEAPPPAVPSAPSPPPVLTERAGERRWPTLEQLNLILARQLQSDPLLANRRISVEKGASGDIHIFVDERRYERLEEIEEPAIQQVFRRAVQEWNAGA
jgi:hypothetical protein